MLQLAAAPSPATQLHNTPCVHFSSHPDAANNQTWGLTHPAFCNLPNDTAICVPTSLAEADAYFEPAERRLTLEQYQDLKKDPSNTGVLDFFQWGTCTERAEALQVAGLPECGEPGGPCGPELCSQGNRTCPDG